MTYQANGLTAVLDDRGITAYNTTNTHPPHHTYGMYELSTLKLQDMSLAELLAIGRRNAIDTIWVTPGSLVSHRAKAMLAEAEGLPMRKSAKRDGTPRFLLVWNEGGKSVKIAFPEHDTRWPWHRCMDGKTLLYTIVCLQDALQHEIAWSPGHTGQDMMLEGVANHPDWFAPATIPDVVKQNLALDMQWKRPLTPEEQAPGMWLHVFDGNSKYWGACTGANLGEGDPMHSISPIFNPRTPGIWNVSTEKHKSKWIWTPELEYVRTTQDILIHEAWIWEKYHQTLRHWASHMWEARQSLKDKNELAYQTVKPIGHQALGWLAMESKHGDNKLYRPDWWSMIVATALRSMGFKVRQLERQGLFPCYVNVDALGLISEGPSLDLYQKYILNRQGQLGGFKHVGSVHLTRDLAATFTDEVRFSHCHDEVMHAIEEAQKGQPV